MTAEIQDIPEDFIHSMHTQQYYTLQYIYMYVYFGQYYATDNGQKYSHTSNFPYVFHIKLQFSKILS